MAVAQWTDIYQTYRRGRSHQLEGIRRAGASLGKRGAAASRLRSLGSPDLLHDTLAPAPAVARGLHDEGVRTGRRCNRGPASPKT